MKSLSMFAFISLFALSALSLAEDAKNRPRPPATVAPAEAFSLSSGAPTTTPTPAPTNTTTPAHNTTTPAHNTTTPTHNTTTPAHNTTTSTPAHNTTTPAHNTTTPAHNTTTPAHNTTTPAHNTTTINPNTTTTTPKTTIAPTPTPTPTTQLDVGSYTVKDSQNKVCLKAQFALQIRIVSDKPTGTFIVNPNVTKASGICHDSTANLTLAFKEGSINFTFYQNDTKKIVSVTALSFKITYSFKGGNGVYTASNTSLQLFPAKFGHSYSCRNESVFMGNDLYLDLSQDEMQAFNLTSDDFGTPDPCPADRPDYSVAIGVGVALLILIVIVVVVYILSRKKRTDGYQSL